MLAKSSGKMGGMASEADGHGSWTRGSRNHTVPTLFAVCRPDTFYCYHVIHGDQTSRAIPNPHSSTRTAALVPLCWRRRWSTTGS